MNKKIIGKRLLTISFISFCLSLIFGFSWLDREKVLKVKKYTVGLEGSEVYEWIVKRYTPTVLFYGAVLLLIIGIVFLIISARKKS